MLAVDLDNIECGEEHVCCGMVLAWNCCTESLCPKCDIEITLLFPSVERHRLKSPIGAREGKENGGQ